MSSNNNNDQAASESSHQSNASSGNSNSKSKITTKHVKFNLPITELNTSVEYSIEIFSGIQSQDFALWIRDFNEASSLFNWNASQKLAVFKIVLQADAKHCIKDSTTFSAALKSLKDQYYPPAAYAIHAERLLKIQKFSNETIKAYYDRLSLYKIRMELCMPTDEKVSDRELYQAFINGLPKNTKDEIINQGVQKLKDAYSLAERLFYNEKNYQKQPKKNFYDKKNMDTKQLSKNTKFQRNDKFCKFHKTNTHNDSECKAQQQLKPKQNNNVSHESNHTSNNIITEEPKDFEHNISAAIGINKMRIPISLNGKTLHALLDTGSSVSLIDHSIVSDLKLQLNTKDITKIKSASSHSFITHGSVTTTLKIPSISNTKQFKTKFYCIENLAAKLILGIDFLDSHAFKLNFGDQTISLTNKITSQKINSNENYDPDDYFTHHIIADELLKEFQSIIGNDNHIGCIQSDPFQVSMPKDITPIQCRPYRIPFSEYDKVKNEINRLLQLGLIRESKSPWASPAFTIKKKDGSLRLLVDYRKLNKIIVPTAFPLPHMEDLLFSLHGSSFFSKLDFNSGFFQVTNHPDTIKFTSFVLPFGQYEHLRMPQGMASPPKHFQKVMSRTFSKFNFVKVFIDDLLIHSRSEQEHRQHLRTVLTELTKINATINLPKCQFFLNEVTYLGYTVNQYGVKPAASNIEILKNWKIPTNQRGVKSILGSLNFFRNLIPNFSIRMDKIIEKTKEKSKFQWTKRDTNLINEIINELEIKASICHPNFKLPFVIHTDASLTGVGAVVSQESKPIYFFSRRLNSAQSNYTTTEKEALAIVWTLTHLKSLLFGQKIIIYTDHSNLKFLSTSPLQRVQRWQLIIDEFNPEINYIKGSENELADLLSRIHAIDVLEEFDYPLHPKNVKQFQDIYCTKENYSNCKHFEIKDDMILYKSVVFIPTELQAQIISWFHYNFNHMGITKMYNTIKELAHWPTLHADIIKFVSNCSCNREKTSNKKYGQLMPPVSATIPFQHIAMDILGPFDFAAEEEDVNILTIIDLCTRWIELVPLSRTTGREIAIAFDNQWLCRYPKPEIVTTDQGSNFLSEEFQEMLKSYSIKHQSTTTYQATGNSICERSHSYINNALRVQQATDLSKLQSIAWSMRSSYHRVLDCSPGSLVFGQNMLSSSLFYDKSKLLETSLLRKKQVETYDLNRTNKQRIDHIFQPNQLVYIKNYAPTKLQPRYSGPFRIISVDAPHNVCRVDQGTFIDTVNFRRLKPFFGTIQGNQEDGFSSPQISE